MPEDPPDLHRAHRWKIYSVAVICIVLGVLFVVYDDEILNALKPLNRYLISLGLWGHVIVGSGVFLCSFPPIFGYSSVVIFAGYLYGFFGLVSTFVGALVGATVCFPIFRRFGQNHVEKFVAQDARFRSVITAVEKKGFWMLFWIRLTPLSYCVINAILPSIPDVSFTSYLLATALSLPKLLVHVFIGTRLAELADRPDPTTKAINYVYLVVAGILGLGLLYYLYKVAWSKVEAIVTTDGRVPQSPTLLAPSRDSNLC